MKKLDDEKARMMEANELELTRLAEKACRRAREYRLNVNAQSHLEAAARELLEAVTRTLAGSLGSAWARKELERMAARLFVEAPR